MMTYPHPSESHQELVCTAGVTEDLQWVRLYPIDYRYQPQHRQFRKYQWIEIGLAGRGAKNDGRKESRKPDLDSIRILGEPLSTDDEWRARREIIDRMPHHTRLELEALYNKEKVSLGIVRPVEVLDLKVEPVERHWKPEWEATLRQFNLFSGQPKLLEKLPYRFSYVFRCADTGDKPHTAMIEDWELGVLYRKEVERLGDERNAIASVRRKYFDEICHPSRDSRFFMGTVFPYNTWVVAGVFWPPKLRQASLFS
ncbi:MAG: hypothetical protein SFV51_12670 [Bryobacteraceae bacterium]|nr:hypothetical protein [Bryobacteraceae bacterium]